jgi:O-antigen/teichoic acid export membrane protein
MGSMTETRQSTTSKVVKGSVKLSASQGIGQVSLFVRNVILARMISTADLGVASIFGMTAYLLEMMSNLATETLLVQAPDGDEPPFQATSQLVIAGRGVINAVLLLFLATPLARLFGVPQARWAFACMALVPLIKGFTHLDPNRVQRHMQFEPWILVNLIPSVVVTVLAYPLAAWLRNYTVMLWLLIAQMAVTVLVSHLVAKRRYAWGWNPHYAKKIFKFGWPLMINGVLMYLIFQGDRFVIGAAHQLFPKSSFTLGDLGVYSVAFGLTLAPSLLVASVSSSLFLPLLSRTQHDRHQFQRRYFVCAQVIGLGAAMITIPFVAAGGPLVVFVYGQKYAAAAHFIGWLAAMQFLRTMRVVPTLATTALGDTQTSMYSNVARTSAFLASLMVAALGRDMTWIAACGFFGELLAGTVSLYRLQRRCSVPAIICLKPAAAAGAGLVISALIGMHGSHAMQLPLAVFAATCVMALVVCAMLVLFPGLRQGFRAVVFRSEPSATV